MTNIGTGGLSRGNLPAETTSFVGRRRELAAVDAALRRTRVTTVVGPGGVGKTRLALRAAGAARDRYPDGAWLAELSALRNPDLLPLTVSESLRIVDQTVRPMREVLAEWLVDKRLLLVLDTCEHLVRACAHLVAELTTVAPGLTVLCTSRQPLRVHGEHLLELRPLGLPGHPDDRDGDSLALFTDRAAAAVPGLRFTAVQQAAAAQVCRRLDGIPLALELAGARLRQTSVEELAAQLRDSFEVLTTDEEHTCPPRHRALRTAIGWSHQLCTPLERLLWARLSVFAGSFDAALAQQVCAGGPLTADLMGPALAGLVDKSVVVLDGGRHRMLDTVREYGAQWLAGLGEEKEVRRRHAEAYLGLAREVDADWFGPRQRGWYERLSAEHSNLRAALDFHLGCGDAAAAVGMAGALWCFWFCCGFQREGCDYLDRALALAPAPELLRAETGPVRDRVKAVWVRGYLAFVQGDVTTALDAVEECAALARAGGRTGADLAVAHLTGAHMTLRGDHRASVAAFAGWPQDAPGDHAVPFWVTGRLTLGYSLAVQGEFAEVTEVMTQLRQECADRGDFWASATALYLSALAESGLGHFERAHAYADEALTSAQMLRDTLVSGFVLDVLATVTLAQGHAERSARFQGVAHHMWRQVGGSLHTSSPHLLQARQACAEGARAALGNAAYERVFRETAALGLREGIACARGSGAS